MTAAGGAGSPASEPAVDLTDFFALVRKTLGEAPPATPASMSPASVTRFGPYELAGFLGQGAGADVWLARDTRTGRSVALKFLRTSLIDDVSAVRRFLAEGDTLRRLDHPGIVGVIDHGSIDGRPYLALEAIEGLGLDRILLAMREPSAEAGLEAALRAPAAVYARTWRRRRLGAPHARDLCALAWIRQIAAALGHAHAYGVLHRDVKPANIVIDREGHARLIDFGVASTEESDLMTLTGAVLGTPRYMSPEAIRGHRTAQGDVYGLGVVALETLTGRVPYDGRTAAEVEAARDQGPAPTLKLLRPDLRNDLHWVVGKSLAPSVGDRYATGDLFARDLTALLAGRGTVARGPTGAEAWRAFATRHPTAARTLVGSGVAGLIGVAVLATRGLVARSEGERVRAETAKRADVDTERKVRATIAQLVQDSPVELWRLEAQSVAVLTRLASPQATRTVTQLLARVTGEFRHQRRLVYERAGDVPGLAAALAELDRLLPGDPPSDATATALATAVRKLKTAGVPDLRSAILYAEDTAYRGRGSLVAKVCAEALGRIGIAEGAVESLASYLAVEEDEERAALAGVALVELSKSGDDARIARWIGAVARRFPAGGAFRSQVALYMPAAGANFETEGDALPDMSPSYGGRRIQGEVTDRSGAVLLNPQILDSWLGLGIAKDAQRLDGDPLDGARQAVELDPMNALAWQRRGYFEAGAGRLGHAIWCYTRAGELDPKNGYHLIGRGNARRVLGDVYGAASDFERAAALFDAPRGKAEALASFGLARLDGGDPAGAIEACDEAARLMPGYGPARAYRGMAKLIAGDTTGAIEDAQAALKLGDENAEVWHCLGCARLSKGDIDGALAASKAAIDNTDAYILGWNGRGVALLAASDRARDGRRVKEADELLDASIAAFSKAITCDGHIPFAWINRAIARLRRGPSEVSVTDASEAISRLRRLPHGYLARAVVKAGFGRTKEAASDAAIFVALAPEHPAVATAARIQSGASPSAGPTAGPTAGQK